MAVSVMAVSNCPRRSMRPAERSEFIISNVGSTAAQA